MSFRERSAAFICAVAIEVLIALLFLFALMPALSPKEARKEPPPLFGFDVGDDRPAPSEARSEAKTRARGDEAEKARAETPVEPEKAPDPTLPDPPVAANVLWLSRPDYASADIGKSRRSAAADAEPAASESTRSVAGDSQVAEGKGPNGETMYRAEWYREPSDAEGLPYVPQRAKGRGGGWGRIGCRTAPRYRVVDCFEIAESPRGSGLAGAARQMSFQFLMKPTRIGGRQVIGEWIEITFYYSETREGR